MFIKAMWAAGGLAVTACATAPPLAEITARGKPIPAAQFEAFFQIIFPNGAGLPAGRGTAAQGKVLFAQRCASCHGQEGIGASAEELAHGTGPLTSASPDKTVGLYWPYATTLFDFIRRAMPMNAPQTLSTDEVYAITAYLLKLNAIDVEGEALTHENLATIKMPNRDGFVWIEAQR